MTDPLVQDGELCGCGHPTAQHTVDGICYAKLDTFPEGGFGGVCPCTPGWLEARAGDDWGGAAL